MIISNACIHRCTIERANYAIDLYGQRVSTWLPVAINVPCRLVQDEVQSFPDGLGGGSTTTVTTLIVLPTTGLTEGDRITNVIDEAGAGQPGVYEVRALTVRRRGRYGASHIRATIERIAATGGIL